MVGALHLFPENALIEILMLAGFYRTVSYLTNAMNLPLEDVGIRFPSSQTMRSRVVEVDEGIQPNSLFVCLNK